MISWTSRRFDLIDGGFRVLRYVTTLALLTIILVPLLFVISVSFRPPAEFYTPDIYLIPKNPTLSSWALAIETFGEPLKNSAMIAIGTMLLSLLIAVPGAYVFGRKSFPGKELAFYGLFLSLLFPHILLIIPISDLWYQLGLYNTIPGMWIAMQVFVTPFVMYILRDYFEKLPENLEEAAQVFGCSELEAFVRVVLPVATPAMAAVGFLSFLSGWNDFLFANMLTSGYGPRPAIVQLFLSTQTSGGQIYWGKLMAIVLVLGLPPTVLYLVSRSYLSQAFDVA